MAGRNGITRLGLTATFVACAALVLCAPVAAVAHAEEPRWHVGGNVLGAGEDAPFTASSGPTSLAVPSLGMTIGCESTEKSGALTGSTADEAGGSREVAVRFSGCMIVEAHKCEVRSTNEAVGSHAIRTVALKSRLVWLTQTGTSTAGDLLEPESGTAFVELKIEGKGCALAFTGPLRGSLLGVATPVESESATGHLEFPPSSQTYWTGDEPSRVSHTAGLTYGTAPMTYQGEDAVTLNSGKEFGVFPG